MKSLTVIVCTHNRSHLLNKLLKSLNDSIQPDNFDIRLLVVANACTDNTEELLQEYQIQKYHPRIPLEWLREPKVGKSNALNTALSSVETELTALVDDDHRVDGKYFQEIKKAVINNPETDLFCGRILPDWDGTEPGWVHVKGHYRIYPLPVPNFDLGEHACDILPGGPIPGGGNLILNSALLNKVGKFNVGLGPKGRGLDGSEDTDYVLRALSLNFRAKYIPGIIQYHYVDHNRLKLSYILRKSYYRSRSISSVRCQEKQVPAYLWKKLVTYMTKAIISASVVRTRFYLVRCMAVIGEMSAIRSNQ